MTSKEYAESCKVELSRCISIAMRELREKYSLSSQDAFALFSPYDGWIFSISKYTPEFKDIINENYKSLASLADEIGKTHDAMYNSDEIDN